MAGDRSGSRRCPTTIAFTIQSRRYARVVSYVTATVGQVKTKFVVVCVIEVCVATLVMVVVEALSCAS